jgi:hypothetical protein
LIRKKIEDFNLRISTLQALNKGIKIQLKQVEINRNEYIKKIELENRDTMSDYQNKFQIFTTMGLSLKRLPNETDDEYNKRMQDNINAIKIEDQLFDGARYLEQEFIAKLRTLNLPLDIVESTCKSIDDEIKEWTLASWPAVKTEFIKNFGSNPFRLKSEHVIDFLDKMHHSRYASSTRVINVPNDVSSVLSNSTINLPANTQQVSDKASFVQNVQTQTGEGFRSLGKKQVNVKKLLNNTLDVRHAQKSNIYGFPVVSVSDLFVSYVNRLMNNQKISLEDISKLYTNEQLILNRLVTITGANGGGFHDEHRIDALKKRLQLIEDEIRSGNDSPHLLTVAKEILTSFSKQQVIGKAEAKRFYKQLSKVND